MLPPIRVGSFLHYDEEHKPALCTNQRPPRDCRGPGAFLNPADCPGGAPGTAGDDGTGDQRAFNLHIDDRSRRADHLRDRQQHSCTGGGCPNEDDDDNANGPSNDARCNGQASSCSRDQGDEPNRCDTHRQIRPAGSRSAGAGDPHEPRQSRRRPVCATACSDDSSGKAGKEEGPNFTDCRRGACIPGHRRCGRSDESPPA